MPKDEFDPDDPMERVSVPMPGADEEMEQEMTRCLAEEFIRMGSTDEEVLAMFRNPFYSVPHGVYLSRGEESVKKIISQARASWLPAGE